LTGHCDGTPLCCYFGIWVVLVLSTQQEKLEASPLPVTAQSSLVLPVNSQAIAVTSG